MSTFGGLLVVCLNPEEQHQLLELAGQIGFSDTEIIVGTIQDVIGQLKTRSSCPNAMLIDIGTRGHDVLAEIDELALHCEADVNVVVIGSVNDITFYRELKQRGILEYFPRPADSADIKQAFSQALMARVQRLGAPEKSVVITCMSAASGDGASTVAVNLSHCLAEQKFSTVLVDMDYQFGLIAKSLDLSAPFGIRELFDHPDRGLDDTLVEKMLVKYGEKLKIVASPNELQILPTVRPEVIRDLIAILRSKFQFVIIDVPHIWTHYTAAALKNADHNLLVGQLWLRSLTHATRLFTAWQNVGIPSDHVSLVINRSGAKFKEAISSEEFERVCHHKIDAYLHNDIKSVVSAENQGKTVCEVAVEGSMLPQQFQQIAAMMAERFGMHSSVTPVVEAPVKKGLRGIFDKKVGN